LTSEDGLRLINHKFVSEQFFKSFESLNIKKNTNPSKISQIKKIRVQTIASRLLEGISQNALSDFSTNLKRRSA
jgi:hypothetical protein